MKQPHTPGLLRLLKENKALRARGFSVSRTREGEIVIDRFGHVHGIWDFDGRTYNWVSPGSSDPQFRTGDAKSAVVYTLVALAQEGKAGA